MSQTRTALPSTPSNPAELRREIGTLTFELSPDGLTIVGLPGGHLTMTVDETLALADFWRTPGARLLAARAWLAEQHAAVVGQA